MEKSRSISTILVFFGLDPAPPSFRHARPRVRRPLGLDSSVLGPVSNSVVPDLFRKSARQEKGGTFPLAVCEKNMRRLMVSQWGRGTSAALGKCNVTLFLG